jgi:hypothetical protein
MHLQCNMQRLLCFHQFQTSEMMIPHTEMLHIQIQIQRILYMQMSSYDETFAPVEKMDSIRLALSIAATRGWEVHHMDVKNAFLHGDLEEEIYMEQPQGYMQNSSLVCKLKKSLYGLKQAPRAWYAKMDSYLLSQNFVRCKSDSNVYF